MTTTSAAPGEPLSFLIMRGENANVQVRKGDRILGTHRVTGTVRVSDLDAAPARPAATAVIRAAAAGLTQTRVETLPFSSTAAAHERLEKQTVTGRLVLRP